MMPRRTIRIVSDGTPSGTRVLNDDGRPIAGVGSVVWTAKAGEAPQAILTFPMAQLDVSGEAVAPPPGEPA